MMRGNRIRWDDDEGGKMIDIALETYRIPARICFFMRFTADIHMLGDYIQKQTLKWV